MKETEAATTTGTTKIIQALRNLTILNNSLKRMEKDITRQASRCQQVVTHMQELQEEIRNTNSFCKQLQKTGHKSVRQDAQPG